MCRRPRAQSGRRSWGRFRMREPAIQKQIVILSEAKDLLCAHSLCASARMTMLFLLIGLGMLPLFSCSQPPDPNTLVMIIESSPTNLDPRVGIDGQSERIDELLFDALRSEEHTSELQSLRHLV